MFTVRNMLRSFLFALIVFGAVAASAKNKTYVPQPLSEVCRISWDSVWPRVREGEKMAGAYLFVWMGMHLIGKDFSMYAPGSGGDSISKMADIAVLGVHFHSYRDPNRIQDLEKARNGRDQIIMIMRKAIPGGAQGADEFFDCLEESVDSDCSGIALENRLVMPLEAYTARIDALIAQGYKPTCEDKSTRR